MGTVLEPLKPNAKRLPRIYTPGNFCGHIPDRPAFKAVIKRLASKPRQHPILRKAILAIGDYYHSPALLKLIDNVLHNGESRKKRQDGKYRKTRSERRDAVAMCLAFMLSETNLMKLQVGIIPYSDFKGLIGKTYQNMADELGLSLSRVKRACQHIKKAGYISITPRRDKQSDGTYKALSPIICIKQCLFVLIGISKEWLEGARSHQFEKWKAERNKRFSKAVQKQTDKKQAEAQAQFLFMKSQLESNDLMKEIQETVSRFPSKSQSWRQRIQEKYRKDISF